MTNFLVLVEGTKQGIYNLKKDIVMNQFEDTRPTGYHNYRPMLFNVEMFSVRVLEKDKGPIMSILSMIQKHSITRKFNFLTKLIPGLKGVNLDKFEPKKDNKYVNHDYCSVLGVLEMPDGQAVTKGVLHETL